MKTPDPATNEQKNEPLQPLEPEAAKPSLSYPLTGLQSDKEMKERPVMVMVENSPKARPQTGLDQADIVYEILAEGDITRFVAVYQSQKPEVIGPVRSIRPYFVQLGEQIDAVIVHAGWSQDAMNLIASRKLNHLDQVYGDDKYYWRDKSRKAPHNLYTSIEKVREGAVNKKFRPEWKEVKLPFLQNGTTIEGTLANLVTIPYINGYKVSYQYDESTNTYLRTMAGKPHNDKETDKQLSAANLLIVEAKHRILDKAGRRDVDVIGPGKGYLLQQGSAQEIVWENKDGLIRAYANGKELPLLQGKTWVQVVPTGTKVTFE